MAWQAGLGSITGENAIFLTVVVKHALGHGIGQPIVATRIIGSTPIVPVAQSPEERGAAPTPPGFLTKGIELVGSRRYSRGRRSVKGYRGSAGDRWAVIASTPSFGKTAGEMHGSKRRAHNRPSGKFAGAMASNGPVAAAKSRARHCGAWAGSIRWRGSASTGHETPVGGPTPQVTVLM